MTKSYLFAIAAFGFAATVSAQSVGDVITVDGHKYEVVDATNLITNGSFDDGVNGWKTANGSNATVWIDADAANFTITETGGYDEGAYITVNGAGAATVKTLRTSAEVVSGSTYLFTCYTSGKTPDANNYKYNGLWASEDGHSESGSIMYQLSWGAEAGQTTDTWTKNEYVFTASTPYVALRFGWNSSSNLDGFSLIKVQEQFDATVWNNAVADAQAVLDAHPSYTGDEKTAVETILAKDAPTTVDEQNTLVAELKAAVTAFETAAVAAEKDAAMQANIDAYNAVKKQYTFDATSLLDAIENWEGTMVANDGKEHWSGADKYTYWEQSSSQWGQSSWSVSKATQATLPTGKYAFVASGRASEKVEGYIKVGETSVAIPSNGASGKGIALDGTATIADDATYANTAGRGWEWRTLTFESTTTDPLTFEIGASTSSQYQWASIADISLLLDPDYTSAIGSQTSEWQNSQNITGWHNFGTSTNPTGEYNGTSFESWSSASDAKAGKIFYKSLTGLPAGVYSLKAAVMSQNQGGEGSNDVNFYANEASVNCYGASTKYYTLDNVVVGDDGALELGVEALSDNSANWSSIADLTLTLVAFSQDAAAKASLQKYIDEAKAIAAEKMNAETLAALNTAIETAEALVANEEATAEELLAGVDPLKAASATAQTSVNTYASIAEALAAGATLDEAGKAKFDELTATVSEAYEAATITDGATELASAKAALVEAVKAQTTPDSDLTPALPTDVADWTAEGADNFHLNTWSPKADNDLENPYLEDWKASGSGSLADATMSAKVTGLTPGKYKVAADFSVNRESDNVTPTGGAYIFANDAQTQLTAGETLTSKHNGIFGNYEVEVEVGEDGVLTYGVIVKDADYNWIAFKNFTLTLVEVAAPEVSHKTTVKVEVSREAGATYDPTTATADLSKALEFLGIEDISAATLVGLNADGTVVADGMSTYDGWRDSDGNFASWGDASSSVCVKFVTTSESDNVTIHTHAGHADVVPAAGSVYNAYWALTTATDTVVYDIEITFTKPSTETDPSKYTTVNTYTIDVTADYDENGEYLTTAADLDYTAIKAELGLTEVTTKNVAAIASDGTLNFTKTTYTGYYYDANGAIASWGTSAKFFFESDYATNITVGQMAGTVNKAGESFAADFYVVNPENLKMDKVTINYTVNAAVGIDAVDADDVVKAVYYNAAGVASETPHQGLNIVKKTLSDGKTVTEKVYVK